MNALTTSNHYFCSRSLYINPKYYLVPTRKGKIKQIFTASLSERRTEGEVDDSPATPSARTQLDFLEQLTTSSSGYASDGNNEELTIREKLALLVGDRDDDFTLRLGKKLKVPKLLTVSQKRNIKRQAYLNEVSRRNDSTFFATIGAFVLLPPIFILVVAIATGYVQLFP
uniref:uncharacterized protein LOC122611332 isoform X2 n=1 Tax=Erigeron canadensis TaxID=72917 RepID=UPI001CB8AD3A|nr:uncharacterized protein LOC122611332 isoform X2 [Erigeron canadensis]